MMDVFTVTVMMASRVHAYVQTHIHAVFLCVLQLYFDKAVLKINER